MREIWIGFAGSRYRYFRDLETGKKIVRLLIRKLLSRWVEKCGIDRLVILHGGNFKSVDALVHEEARRLGLEVLIFEPHEWTRPRLAERTIKLALGTDYFYCIFVDTWSRGTLLAYRTRKRVRKHVAVYYIDTINRRVMYYGSTLPIDEEEVEYSNLKE